MATSAECNICMQAINPETHELVNALFINGVWTCRNCITDVVRRVAQLDDSYPARMNGQPIDLDAYSSHVDNNVLEQYYQLQLEHTTHPYLRVYCACGRFIGKTATADPINPFLTVGECPSCKKAACMSCSTSLDQDYTLAGALDHGCKEKLGAKEKDYQDALNGSDRGKRYQICPTCRRFCQLAEACHHINCPCGEQYCYKCGERATADSDHWSSMRRTPAGHCPQYPRPGQVEAAVDDDTQQRDRPAHQFPIDENLRLGIYRGPILTQAEIDQGARERLWDLRLMNGRVRRVDQAARNRPANEQHPANDRQVPAAPADGQLEQEVRERLQRYYDAPPRPVSPVEDEIDRAARERLDRYRLAHDQDGAIGDAAARQPRLTQNR